MLDKAGILQGQQASAVRTSSRQGASSGNNCAQPGNAAPGTSSSENRKSTSQIRGRSGGGNFNVQVLVPESKGQEFCEPPLDLTKQTQASGKKVSAATLKRRQKELNDKKKESQRDKSANKSHERKPLFSRKMNATFAQKADTDANDEIQILEPKKGKPPLGSVAHTAIQPGEVPSRNESGMKRKTKAQRNAERSERAARQSTQNNDSENEPEIKEGGGRRKN